MVDESNLDVLYLVDCWPPNHDGGDSIFARDLIIHLNSSAKFSSSVISSFPKNPNKSYSFFDVNTQVYRPNLETGNILSYLQHKPDIIHSFQINNLPVLKEIKEKYESKVIFHMQLCFHRYAELFEPDYDAKLYHQMENEMVGIADTIICPSNEEKTHIQRIFSPEAEIIVIPNSINYNLRLSEEPSPKVDRGKIKFVFAGRVDDPMKGGDIVVSSIHSLPKYLLSKSEFYFMGVRDHRFQELVQSLPKECNYRMFPWRTSQSEFLSQLSLADAVLIPSLYEPFGILCLESMSLGLVPIATSTGGLREIVQDKINGLSLPDPSKQKKNVVVNSMCSSMKYIVENKSKLKYLSSNAIRTARKKYSIHIFSERFKEIYKRSLEV